MKFIHKYLHRLISCDRPYEQNRPRAQFEMSLRPLCLSLALLCAMLAVSYAAAGCNEPDYQSLKLGSTIFYKFPVYSNRDLATADLSSIKHVLVIQHGIERGAHTNCATGMKLLAANPERASDTLIVAPKFVGQSDLPGYAGHVVFRDGGWSDGEDSVQPFPISSYQVNTLSPCENAKRLIYNKQFVANIS